MRVRQSVREKNNGRVCRHSRARRIVRFFHETKTSLLPAEHLKKVFVWREELNEIKNEEKNKWPSVQFQCVEKPTSDKNRKISNVEQKVKMACGAFQEQNSPYIEKYDHMVFETF